jgi:hypothetical protein
MMVTFTKNQSQLEVELLTCALNWSQTDRSLTNWRGSFSPFSNEFQGPVSRDLTQQGSVCDWCGQTGEQRLSAIGGSFHNMSGVFCNPCGQQFMERVVNS